MIVEAHDLGLRVLLDIVPNHLSDQHAWFQEALAAATGLARAGPLHLPRRPRTRRRRAARTTGRAISAAPPGHASPRRTAAPDSGTCICSRPSSRTSTGPTPTSADGVRPDDAFLVRARGRRLPHRRRPRPGQGRRASRTSARSRGRRSPPRWSTIRTGTATRSTTSTGRGARWPTPTTIRGCSSPRRGCITPSDWPSTSAPTSCTPRSTSTSCSRRGRPSAMRESIIAALAHTRRSALRPPGSSPTTTRSGRSRATPGPRASGRCAGWATSPTCPPTLARAAGGRERPRC